MQSRRYAAALERARGEFAERRASSIGFNIATPRYQIGNPQWQAPNAETYAKAFRSQAALYACVVRRANAVSQAPLRVYKESDGDPDEQAKHLLRKLLAHPNPLVSEAEFHVITMTHMDVLGFAAIEIERAVAGSPLALWHLRPDWLRMIPQRNAAPVWEYRVAGNDPKIIPAENIIVISGGPSTDLKPIGMPPIEVALREVGINDSATDFLKIFIDTGGVPRVALEIPHEIKEQAKADAIRERWSQVYGGYKNWSQVAILHGGMTVKDVGISLDSLAYPELRALLETHICTVYGVPPILVGILAGLDASTYSNYEQARKAFFEDTVSALWSRIAGALGRALLPELGDATEYLAFDTSAVVALQEDRTQAWQRAKEALTAGGITLNQFQAAVGLPGFGANGDVLLLPFSVQATRPDDLPKLADQTAEPPAPVPAALAPGDGEDDPPATDEDEEDEDRSFAVDGILVSDSRELMTLPLETRARIVSNNRRNVTRLASQAYGPLAALFAGQGARVATAYGKRAGTRYEHEVTSREFAEIRATRDVAEVADLFDDLDGEVTAFLTTFYQRAGDLSYRSASRTLGVGIDFDLSNPFVRRTQRDLARRIVGINETTRNDVRRVIADGIEAGKNHKGISDDLRGLYEETYRGRSLTIARTESQVAYNLGTADAYKASGRVLAMILHDNAAHTDDPGSDGLTCAQRDGVITDVDAVARHIYAEHPNGTLATSPLLVRPLGNP